MNSPHRTIELSASRQQDSKIRTEPSTGMMSATAGLLLLTVVVRIGIIVTAGDRLHSDPDAYVRLATMLADGKGFAAADGVQPTAFRPVLYPLLLAGPLLLGIPAATAVAFWNLLAGPGLVFAAIQLARELGLNRRGTLIAGFAAAVDPLTLRYTTEPMTENVCAAIFTAALVCLLRIIRQNGLANSPSNVGTAAVGGVLLGIGALCRPVILVSCAVLTLTMTVLQWKSCRDQRRVARLSVARMWIPAIVAALTVAPWIIRNAVQFAAFIPATTHGGYTLLLGNNSEFYERVVSGKQAAWDNDSLTAWQHDLRRQLSEAGLEQADEPAVDRWMYERAGTEMKAQPTMAGRAVALRWRRFWALTPTASGAALPRYVFYAVGTWYGLLGIGLLASLRQCLRNPNVLLLWMSVMSFLLVHSFYWTNTRMRAPLTGVLVVLAVSGWTSLTWRGREREPHEHTGHRAADGLNEQHPA